ncbi:class I SAM-dependent methyltransferase [Haloarcula halophila]|uniref:class I SAM-dependent methyltransferase n=1 Tax=Haloarcula TaxID=2237 RepID=UPI0023E4453C|nr:class I SAM-dependent methyltransferase [Halomicroarcula sp. DFY41]
MTTKKYEIDEFAFIGRTFTEYQKMFDFDPASWAGQSILDCPAGPCSFVAVAHEHDITAVGADKMYNRSPAALSSSCAEDIETAMDALDGVEDLYVWEFYDDVSELRAYRERAASRFLSDYAHNGDRYVYADLPATPFDDHAFDLVLSAHFLFLYDDRLSYEFHLETIRELCRVGAQLRVFPLHGFDADQSDIAETLVKDLQSEGYTTDIREVPFEFQRGANKMLVVE